MLSLVSTGAVWRYVDDGSNQDTAWRSPAFNDTTWQYGVAELGYGDSSDGRPEATVIPEWLRPGTHLDLIGSFTPDMCEADAAC